QLPRRREVEAVMEKEEVGDEQESRESRERPGQAGVAAARDHGHRHREREGGGARELPRRRRKDLGERAGTPAQEEERRSPLLGARARDQGEAARDHAAQGEQGGGGGPGGAAAP